MDFKRNSLLNMSSAYFCHGKSVEELGQSWLCTNMELESLKMQAQEEIRRRDEQLNYVKELLYKAMKERDEAVQKCQALQIEILLQQNQQQLQTKEELKNTIVDPFSGLSSIDDELEPAIRAPDSNNNNNNNFSLSDCDESIVSSPVTDSLIPVQIIPHQTQMTKTSKLQSFQEEVMNRLLPETNRPLPEKGKLLEAVMNAGPLLQTLLLAGPLPQWRHPPPPLESFEIPQVNINISNNNNNNRMISRKRVHTSNCSDSSTDQSHKLQKQHTLLHQ
ncbi:hypothetical protein QQ045_016543 [Rhodiola kirilowii]